MTRRFEIGESSMLGAQQFRVLGRVVYGNADALWDEWYVQLPDGSCAWLEMEDGQRFLSRKQPLMCAVPSFDSIAVGQHLILNEQPFFVTEKCCAEIMQIEGETPHDILVGDTMSFVDGSIVGEPASLEFGADAVEFVRGEII